MPLAPNNILLVQFGGDFVPSGTRWVNSCHYKVTQPIGGASDYEDCQSVATTLHGLYATKIMDKMSEECRLLQVRVKRIESTPSVMGYYAAAVAGTVTEDLVEPNSAVVLSFRTDTAGRRGLGRIYLPGVPTTDAVNGRLGSTPAGLLEGAAEDLFKDEITVGAGKVQAVVWSQKEFDESASIPDSASLILDILCDRIIRKQSRRDWKGQQYE